MCPGLWGKATSVPTQCRSCVLPAGPLSPLLYTPGPSFLLLSAACPIGRLWCVCVRMGYFKTLLNVPGFSTSAPGQVLCPRAPLPGRHPGPRVVAAEPALSGRRPRAPAPRALFLGFRSEWLGRDLAPRFLGPPAGAPDCRGGEAAWDAEAPGPFRGPWRGRPGGSNWKDARGAGQPRWSQARRWRIFEAHCAA